MEKAQAPAKAAKPAKAKPAKAAKVEQLITSAVNAQGGYFAVTGDAGESFLIRRALETPELRSACQLGMPYAAAKVLADALTAAGQKAKLANGVTAHNSPNSAKAVADAAKAAKPAKAAAPAKAAKAAKVEQRKESRKVNDKRIKALAKMADIKAKPDSFRYAMLRDLLASKTVAEFYAKDTKAFHSRYDAGCVRFAVASKYVELA